jgi:hypothetical protein
MSELTLQLARRLDPRRVAFVLACFVGAFGVLGLLASQTFDWALQSARLTNSDLDSRVSMPATFTSLLLLSAAVMALSLARVDRRKRQAAWRNTGWLFVALAVEELLGLHTWLEDRGASWNLVYLPLLVIATLVLGRAALVLQRQRRVQIWFGAAGMLWVGSGAFDALPSDRAHAFGGVELLEMAAACVFVVALIERLRYLARQYYPVDEPQSRASVDALAADALRRIDLRAVATVLAAVIAFFGIQDVILHIGNYHGSKAPILDVNTEQTIPATFSGGLLLVAGALALLAGSLRSTTPAERRWWVALAAVLSVLGMDEIAAIHDRFQGGTGIPGQTILMPAAILGLFAWWKVLRYLRPSRRARLLFLGGAVFWALTQASDLILNPVARWTIVPEETGEMIGSTLWLFALLWWLRHVLTPVPPLASEHSQPVLTVSSRPVGAASPQPSGERAPTG